MLVIVAHKIYGIPQTINTANYVYFLAFQELFALRHAPAPGDQSHGQSHVEAIITSESSLLP
jgi:geranylgeranyl diphosphate synthase type 3